MKKLSVSALFAHGDGLRLNFHNPGPFESPTNRAYRMAAESTNVPKDIVRFRTHSGVLKIESDKLRKRGKLQEAMYVATESQVYREAAEALEGQPQHAEGLAKNGGESFVDTSDMNPAEVKAFEALAGVEIKPAFNSNYLRGRGVFL